MLCPNCHAAVETTNRFCPKCGGGLTMGTARTVGAAGVPVSPQVVQAQSPQGPRVAETRVPIVEGGQKYVGLATSAHMMITSAAIVRLVCYVLAGLTFISMNMLLRDVSATLGFFLGIILGLMIALMGWLLWLALTVSGELMHVIIDVEENMRRRV